MSRRASYNIMGIIWAALFVWLDQWTKALAVNQLRNQEPITLIPGVFQLHYLENRGAAFGLLQNQQFFFFISVVIISIVIIWFYTRVPINRRFLPLRLCAVFIMAGAFGNCIDRVTQRFVVDFFYFSLIDFPIFNVADIYVTVATFFLALLILFYYKEEELALIYRSRTE